MITSFFKSKSDSANDEEDKSVASPSKGAGAKEALSPEQKAVIAEKKAAALAKRKAKSNGAGAVSAEDGGDGAMVETKETKAEAGADFYGQIEGLMHESWRKVLEPEFKKPYFSQIKKFLNGQHGKKPIFPPRDMIFRAFNETTFDQVRVVIIGQDPYHAKGQAEGLCFSVPKGVAIPSSLRNIYKELTDDIAGFKAPKHGNLAKWAKQGVLLLNTSLTVEQASAGSHSKIGWEVFTDAVIDVLNKQKQNVVFILWGKHAQTKGKRLSEARHTVIKGVHPSGLSASKGFFGSKPFSQTNAALALKGLEQIDWTLDP